MISKLIALPYELARLPLVAVDEVLADRLREDSTPRTTLDRTIGSADKFAGTVLRNPGITARGAERLERSKKLRTAAQLEDLATESREEARETVASARDEAARKRSEAADRAASGLQEADTVEARGKQQAEAKATKTATAKKAAADHRAASRSTAVEQRKERAASSAEAKKRAKQGQAKAELDEAREEKQAAAQTRDDAERLSDLTEVKKEQRQQS